VAGRRNMKVNDYAWLNPSPWVAYGYALRAYLRGLHYFRNPRLVAKEINHD
jgi:hypothetical protein